MYSSKKFIQKYPHNSFSAGIQCIYRFYQIEINYNINIAKKIWAKLPVRSGMIFACGLFSKTLSYALKHLETVLETGGNLSKSSSKDADYIERVIPCVMNSSTGDSSPAGSGDALHRSAMCKAHCDQVLSSFLVHFRRGFRQDFIWVSSLQCTTARYLNSRP